MTRRFCAGEPLLLEHCNAIFDAAQSHKVLVVLLIGLSVFLGLKVKCLVHLLDRDVEILGGTQGKV